MLTSLTVHGAVLSACHASHCFSHDNFCHTANDGLAQLALSDGTNCIALELFDYACDEAFEKCAGLAEMLRYPGIAKHIIRGLVDAVAYANKLGVAIVGLSPAHVLLNVDRHGIISRAAITDLSSAVRDRSPLLSL